MKINKDVAATTIKTKLDVFLFRSYAKKTYTKKPIKINATDKINRNG